MQLMAAVKQTILTDCRSKSVWVFYHSFLYALSSILNIAVVVCRPRSTPTCISPLIDHHRPEPIVRISNAADGSRKTDDFHRLSIQRRVGLFSQLVSCLVIIIEHRGRCLLPAQHLKHMYFSSHRPQPAGADREDNKCRAVKQTTFTDCRSKNGWIFSHS